MRPTKKRSVVEAAAPQQEQGETRLELEVITGSLWQPSCRALDPVPSKIPLVFDDEPQYRQTFEPLLMEEARGSLRAEFDEAMGHSKGWPVTVTRCAPAKDGIFHLTLRPGERGHAVQLREGAIVVLVKPAGEAQASTSAGPGPGSLAAAARAALSSSRWPQASGAGGGGQQSEPLLAAMVRMRSRDAGQALEVSVRPCCGKEPHQEETSPCNRILHLLVGSGVSTEADGGEEPGSRSGGGGPLWLWLVPLTNLITNVRELRVLQRLGDIALLPDLLRPSNYGAPGAPELPQVWPQDARHEAFYKYLYNNFDVPQREAIVAAAAHLATPDDVAEAEAQGIATGASGRAAASDATVNGGGVSDRSTSGPSGRTQPLVPPVTLVQGPPGTGKTHTVRGILNTWHSIMYHRHHSAWLRRAREILMRSSAAITGSRSDATASILDQYCSSGGLGGGGAEGILEALSHAPLEAPKPRILVCAPSNAATDELLDRILTDGFCDFGGAMYRPNVVRVGAEEAPLSAAVKAVWTEAMINRYEAMGAESWAVAYRDCEGRINNCKVYMASMAARLAEKGRGEGQQTEADSSQDLDRMAADLVRLNDLLNRAKEEMGRLDRAADLATSGPTKLAPFVVRRIREDLELSLMDEAEMVFTTLSSTGRTVFSRLNRGFDFVLIDEAAQASEIAALQPLLHGCHRLVMVGDPQQLPATLFSAAAKETLLERSLFERLAQAGTPVKMLSVQYRMHPEIRTFPSSYFYNGRLLDGESVLRAAQQPPAFYGTDLLKPYVVYDVCGGREVLQGRSRSNEAEADMALGLYMELLAAVRGIQGIGEQTAEAAAAVLAAGGGAAAAGASGAGVRGVREATPPIRGVGANGGPEGSRAGSVERAVTPDAGQVAAQAFGFLSGYTQSVTVGIITPYRAQREVLRRKFVEALGPGVLDAVRIETVDSFQGKQLDVIILSCVRTVRPGSAHSGPGGGGGVGFLADVRRMNVAITRAKQALWVLGQFAALRHEASWAALIADAEARECIIQDANAQELFPEWQVFHERHRAAVTAAAQALARQGQAAAAVKQQTQMLLQPPPPPQPAQPQMQPPPQQVQLLGPPQPQLQQQAYSFDLSPPLQQQQQQQQHPLQPQLEQQQRFGQGAPGPEPGVQQPQPQPVPAGVRPPAAAQALAVQAPQAPGQHFTTQQHKRPQPKLAQKYAGGRHSGPPPHAAPHTIMRPHPVGGVPLQHAQLHMPPGPSGVQIGSDAGIMPSQPQPPQTSQQLDSAGMGPAGPAQLPFDPRSASGMPPPAPPPPTGKPPSRLQAQYLAGPPQGGHRGRGLASMLPKPGRGRGRGAGAGRGGSHTQ